MQLRQFPNMARAFNLTREQLAARILAPWAAGEPVEWADRRWSPDKAKLTIYEGPELRPEEIGMGRGWANATRSGQDVTARLLVESEPPDARPDALAALRDQILARARDGSLQIRGVVELATAAQPEWRASDRLALAEQAIWELLHRGSVRIVRADADEAVVEPDEWRRLLFDWSTWAGDHGSSLVLSAR